MEFDEIATSDGKTPIHFYVFKYNGLLSGKLNISDEIEKNGGCLLAVYFHPADVIKRHRRISGAEFRKQGGRTRFKLCYYEGV